MSTDEPARVVYGQSMSHCSRCGGNAMPDEAVSYAPVTSGSDHA